MASLTKESNRKGWRLQFLLDGSRRSLYLSDPSKRRAQNVKRHVEELVRAKKAADRPDPATSRWVNDLDGSLFERLTIIGLVEARRAKSKGEAGTLIGPFCDAYIASRTDLKQGTIDNYGHARRLLVEHFGERHPIASVTVADAEQWRRWLLARPVERDDEGNVTKTMAEATVSKHVKRAKTMFAHAVKDRLIEQNPFADVDTGSEVNRDRDHFVTCNVAQAILTACTDPLWRLVFAFARYGGLRRCEVLAMNWDDVLWDAGRMRINSPKTGLRECPIFPELLPYLRDAFAQRPENAVRCIHRYHRLSNLGTQMNRVIEQAGVKPWPKTFQNLRATRRTELQEQFPDHVVNAWLGHSSKTAEKHYLQVTPDHWATASGCGAPSGAITANPPCSTSIKPKENPVFPPIDWPETLGFVYVATPQGLEP